jgi:hypothetical protein
LKTTFHNHLKAFTLCAGFFSLVACKEKSSIKPDLIPGVDSINTFEVTDLAISVKTTHFDSLSTDVYTYPLVAIGGITSDPFFGRTMAGAYLQFIPPAENFTFPTGVIMDSTVISIPYLSFSYADTTRSNNSHALKLRAYEITDNFSDTSVKYYAVSKLAYNPLPVGTGTITVKSLYDTVKLATGDSVYRLLRMRVDGLNDRFKNMSATDLASTAAFRAHFKGIYLGPDTTVAYLITTELSWNFITILPLILNYLKPSLNLVLLIAPFSTAFIETIPAPLPLIISITKPPIMIRC